MPSSKSNSNPAAIGITLGDPGGIGPEIVAKALKKFPAHSKRTFTVIGDRVIFKHFNIKESRSVRLIDLNSFSSYGQIKHAATRANGRASWAYLLRAIQLLRTGQINALVTAPVCKEAIAMTHQNFIGHTEFLAERFGGNHVEMMFVHKNLKIVIVTRHVPLKDVPQHLTSANVLRSINFTHRALKDLFGISRPKLAVSGMNPHAGENGLLGTEEEASIIPAIKNAQRKGINITGPLAADTLFTPINLKRYDAFVAMYHDQGLIPAKTLYFDQLVNLTVGLPFIRTSPDHGTAFDIAGKNKADPGSMIEAIKLADRLSHGSQK